MRVIGSRSSLAATEGVAGRVSDRGVEVTARTLRRDARPYDRGMEQQREDQDSTSPSMAAQESARELEAALADPELAGQVRDVLAHLGSAPFDPVGTPTD